MHRQFVIEKAGKLFAFHQIKKNAVWHSTFAFQLCELAVNYTLNEVEDIFYKLWVKGSKNIEGLVQKVSQIFLPSWNSQISSTDRHMELFVHAYRL